jgi:serine beta-lactamase-like protein LACTB
LQRAVAVGAIAALMLVSACASHAPGRKRPADAVPTPPLTPALAQSLAQARAWATALRASRGLPGLAVAVAVRGEMVMAEGFGWADSVRQIPVSADTQFRIGSVSKLLTATAALRLAQEGRLDLEAPVGRYVAGVPADKAKITLRQLAGHMSGIRQYGRDEFINRVTYRDVTQSLERFLADSLLSTPGAHYRYSSYGYNLLGAALQGAAGKEFREVIAQEVLGPLGMQRTGVEDGAPASGAERAHLYSRNARGASGASGASDAGSARGTGATGGALLDAPVADLSDRWPSGGYLSTVTDMARLGSGILAPDFLTANSRAMLLTPQQPTDGHATPVGIGWRIGVDSQGRRYLHHGGEAIGGRAFLLVYPDDSIVVALATNLTFGSIAEADALALAQLFWP